MTSLEVEIALAWHFNYRTNLIVPNVSWGMDLPYEADIVVLRPSNWGIEIEIKVSASDIKADLKKKHNHNSNLFKELWFAVPEKLSDHKDIPKRAGILSVNKNLRVKMVRKPIKNEFAKKWTENQRLTLLRLASLRTWSLKTKEMRRRRKQK